MKNNQLIKHSKIKKNSTPSTGLEPVTNRLTAERSTY